MNYAHLHLIINHLPILGIPFATVFLAHGLWKGNSESQKFSLLMLVLISLLVLPVYFTGDPAEHQIEELPGVLESFIHMHEEAAEVSLVLTLLAGASALVSLWALMKRKLWTRKVMMATFALSVIAAGSLGYTGNLGGKVRHTEVRSGNAAAPEEKGVSVENKGDEDRD